MSKTYLELTSGYRNRNLYPNPMHFVTNPCELNNSNYLDSANNISNAYPFYNFWSLPLAVASVGDKKQLVPVNYHLDQSCATAQDQTPVSCCSGNSSSVLVDDKFTAKLHYIESPASCPKYHVDNAKPNIKDVEQMCCIDNFFNGMSMAGFIPTGADDNAKCAECSEIIDTKPAEIEPTNRDVDSNCTNANSVSNVMQFNVKPPFSNRLKCCNEYQDGSVQQMPYIVNNTSWNTVRIQGGGPTDGINAYLCSLLEFVPVPIRACDCFPKWLPNGLADRFKVINKYNTGSKLASFTNYECCDVNIQKDWKRMIQWMLYAKCGVTDSSCEPKMLPNSSIPDVGAEGNRPQYIWNFRMRKEMPEMIATSSINDVDGVGLYRTTPPVYIYGVPYSVEVIVPGHGYSRSGYFVYGNQDTDLIEIKYSVSCGEVVSAEITKLAIDPAIYKNIAYPYEPKDFYDKNCNLPKNTVQFNQFIPDVIELSEKISSASDPSYVYSWDGNSQRSRSSWFGGNCARFRIIKGNALFSNLGYCEQTNYACKMTNTQFGPRRNDKKGSLLFIPSVAEHCAGVNALNFSTKYDLASDTPTSSRMQFYKQYPKYMDKNISCEYNYTTPPYNHNKTGTTPILANFNTSDIPIYFNISSTGWNDSNFSPRKPGTFINGKSLVDAAVIITKEAFPGFPKNIEGLYDETSSIKQCCAYEWEILPIVKSIEPISSQLISKAANQEASCWSILLRHLIIPNAPLQSGGFITKYPYIYVELTNYSEAGRNHEMVQSNNPNAKGALFRCTVTDIATNAITKFTKLTGDGMNQIIKFRPNDSVKIRLFLPDGRELMSQQPDTAPPMAPSNLLQITALFELNKK